MLEVAVERKNVVKGKRVDIDGRRIIKKKKGGGGGVGVGGGGVGVGVGVGGGGGGILKGNEKK